MGIDIFVAKYDSFGALIGSTTIINFDNDVVYDIKSDVVGNVYLAGI